MELRREAGLDSVGAVAEGADDDREWFGVGVDFVWGLCGLVWVDESRGAGHPIHDQFDGGDDLSDLWGDGAVVWSADDE